MSGHNYENKENPERCIVRLYEKYVSHRPTDPKCSPAFYLRPLVKPTSNVWYSCQPVGINNLSKTVARLCQQAKLPGFRSTILLEQLYKNDFDEQLVCETTGHRSSAVRAYKRTSDGQKKSISNALYRNTVPHPNQASNNPSCSTSSKDGSIQVTFNIQLDTSK